MLPCKQSDGANKQSAWGRGQNSVGKQKEERWGCDKFDCGKTRGGRRAVQPLAAARSSEGGKAWVGLLAVGCATECAAQIKSGSEVRHHGQAVAAHGSSVVEHTVLGAEQEARTAGQAQLVRWASTPQRHA